MRKRLFNREPLLVEVHDGRWDMYGNFSRRHDKLAKILTAMGGVNETVPPGYYHFNVTGFWPFLTASLLPWTEKK